MKSPATKQSSAAKTRLPKVLISFGTGSFYGMERGVIEIFDLLRDVVDPHFLMSYTTLRLNLPVLDEVRQRNLSFSFFNDKKGWPSLHRPKTLRDAWRLFCAYLSGNVTTFKEAFHCDFLYLPSVRYFYFSVFASMLCRLRGKKVVYQFHDLITRRSLPLRLTSFFVTDFIHCSELGFKLVREPNPYLLTKRNHVFPYRTGSPRPTCAEPSVNGSFKGKLNLLFFGQVSRHKGVDILLNAFDSISRENDQVVLHLVGGCADPEFQKFIDDFIQTKKMNDKVQCWGYRNNVQSLLDIAYVHVHSSPPSRFMDTFPLAVLEAMKSGVPTIGFKSGGVPEMIVSGETGLICDDESATTLALNIRRLLDNPELRNQYAASASQRYEELYSAEPVRELWTQLFGN